MMIFHEKPGNPNCLLGYYPSNRGECEPWQCFTCGWNPVVEQERKAKLREMYTYQVTRESVTVKHG